MASSELDEASKSVFEFLKANIPKREVHNITNELKKDFLLAKKKSKDRKRKTKKRKSKVLARRDMKSLGFFNIPRSSIKYSDMLPLHEAWTEYINQLFELDKSVPDYNCRNWEQFTQTVYKADFHGSLMHVVRSKCPSYVGKKGICVMDTRSTFKIISTDNILTTIPKNESIFEIYVNNIKIAIFGMNLCAKPADRSSKKLKSFLQPDLI